MHQLNQCLNCDYGAFRKTVWWPRYALVINISVLFLHCGISPWNRVYLSEYEWSNKQARAESFSREQRGIRLIHHSGVSRFADTLNRRHLDQSTRDGVELARNPRIIKVHEFYFLCLFVSKRLLYIKKYERVNKWSKYSKINENLEN